MLHPGDAAAITEQAGKPLADLFGKHIYVRTLNDRWPYEELAIAWLAAFKRETPLFDHILATANTDFGAIQTLDAVARQRGISVEHLVFETTPTTETIFDMADVRGAATALLCPDFDPAVAAMILAHTGEEFLGCGRGGAKLLAGHDVHYDRVVCESLALSNFYLPYYEFLRVGVTPVDLVILSDARSSTGHRRSQVMRAIMRGVPPTYAVAATLAGFSSTRDVVHGWETGTPLDYLVTSRG